jgi:organic hydroperoxide reductase OsmC/OhrA
LSYGKACAAQHAKDAQQLDIHCGVDLEWSSANNVGSIVTPTGNVPYSALGRTQGREQPSPEVLLIAALSSCYSITLANVLEAASLPQEHISVHADGVIVRHLGELQVTRVTVSPTIQGADVLRRDAYKKAAVAARDDCLIGRSIRGNVAYIVGVISLL